MDIAKVFEVLSQGKIISSNSYEYSELSNMLLNDSFFSELDEVVNKIGYRLIGESGYFYIAKKGKLTATEQQAFINRHRDMIVAIAFLRHLYPRLDRGNIISFIDTITNYANAKKDDSSVKDRLIYFSWMSDRDDERMMIEQLFKHLENNNIIEKMQTTNTDKYKILDAINYYLSIVDSIEIGDE